ncbi:hypothetical protein M1446_02245 [Candidatus Dependentiae bacterium]|nr:hypothetical protein [Candidatus Dependentiae bacterium]
MKKLIILSLLFYFTIFATNYNINQSVYKMGSDTESNSGSTGNVITISASNVVLDLGGYRVNNTAGISNLDGIVISPNLSNITIKNGSISNFTNRGINIGDGCYNITLENLTIQNCFRAWEFIGTAANRIQNIFTKNCRILSCGNSTAADFIVTFSQCIKLNMQDCYIADINNSTLSTSTVSFLFLNFCDNAEISGINIQNNRGNSTVNCMNLNNISGSKFYDIFIGTNQSVTSTLNIVNLSTISDCSFGKIYSSQNSGSNQLNGFLVTTTLNKNIFDDVLVQDCTATNLTGIFTTTLITSNVFKNFTFQQNQSTTGNCTAVFIANGFDSNVFENFLVQQNLVTTGSLVGFDLNPGTIPSGNTIFTNCTVQKNTALTSGSITGFNFNAGTQTLSGCIFRNCNVIENLTPSGIVNGFIIASGTGTNTHNNFFACNCSGNTTNSGTANGFFVDGVSGTNDNLSFYDCVANVNTSGGANDANGFLIQNSNFGTMVRCAASYNNAPSSVGSGVTFATAGNNRWEVRENDFIRNRGSTNANSFGTRQIVGTTILFTKNVAYNNSVTPPGTIANQMSIPSGSNINIPSGNITTALNGGAPATFGWVNLAGIS